MFRKIIGTIFSKGLTAVANLLILLITTKYLGAYGRGEMAIIILGISIVGLFQNILTGPSLSYLTPRFPTLKLVSFAGIWSVLIAFLLSIVLVFFSLFPESYFSDLVFLSILLGIISIFQNLFVGFEEIKKMNIIEILKAVSTVLFLFWFIIIQDITEVVAVIYALYAAYGVTVLFAFPLFLYSLITRKITLVKTSEGKLFYRYFKIGFQMQLNGISQIVNYRFCYYLVEKYLGLSVLGIFSVATSLIESVWIICGGIGAVHYSRAINLKDTKKQVNLTQALVKMSFIFTLPALVVLFLLPNDFYIWLFGEEFNSLKPIFISLAPGALFLATFTIINYHFASIEKNWINIKSSLIGNILTIIIGFATISSFHIYAGGIATSIAYLGMLIYLFWKFGNLYKIESNWFYLSKKDFKSIFDLKAFE